jgi:hypothetical protein
MCNSLGHRRFRLNRALCYALGLLALTLLLANGEAHAAIHYYFGDISVDSGYDQPLDLNFENDDYDDVVLENYVYSGVNYQGLRIPYSPGKVVGFSSAGVQYVTALTAGAAISSATLGSSYYGALAYGTVYPSAQFASVEDAFIGLAFPIGPTNLYYAWMRVSVDNAAGTLYVKDWAFQDQPGVGITAGDMGTLPIYGDLNNDRHVNGTDYLAWQRGYSTTTSIFDYWKWQDNYGAGTGLALQPAISSIPEPGTFALLFAALFGAASVRRRVATVSR